MKSLGDRMKENYENRAKTYLTRRTPVIIRIDGKAFHTFTKEFIKPFDEMMTKTMQDTMLYLCKNVQGCVFGYTQSDEISLLLSDFKNLNSYAWFDYNVQKVCSVSSSMATFAFNYNFLKNVHDASWNGEIESSELLHTYVDTAKKGALFDSRCFNIPLEEVNNYFIWRQQDATRNSIFSLGRAYFSHKYLQGLDSSEIQNRLFTEMNVNWNNLPTKHKRGSSCNKITGEWIVENETPIFTDSDYVENSIYDCRQL